jgi:hypothetical protein
MMMSAVIGFTNIARKGLALRQSAWTSFGVTGIRTESLPLAVRKSPVAHDCVVVDAARIEPVSTPNSLLAGNLAGNFLKKGPHRTILASKTRAGSIAYKQIPCSTEQGIFLS